MVSTKTTNRQNKNTSGNRGGKYPGKKNIPEGSGYSEDGSYADDMEYIDEDMDQYQEDLYQEGQYQEDQYQEDQYQEGQYQEDQYQEDLYPEDLEYLEEEAPEDDLTEEPDLPRRKWWNYLLNFHTFFLVFAVFVIVTLLLFFKKWGIQVDEDYINENAIYSDGRDTFDIFAPHLDEEGNLLSNKSPHTVLFFGNGPLAEDRDSEDNVVNLVARKIGATVYNCSVSGSFLTAQSKTLRYSLSGQDVYNFYWLTLYLALDDLDYFDWLEETPTAEIKPETAQLRHTLETIDMSTVDTICIMYDASDYLAGYQYCNEDNPTDIRSFVGNLQAGIEILQEYFPHTRIIVLSPTYAFGVEEDGSLVSSDVKSYPGGQTLSTYVLKECEVVGEDGLTFIDNLYGTINEDEAPEYLRDHIHLNQAGREKLATRICSAITHYDK